jgi:hypothetical protein
MFASMHEQMLGHGAAWRHVFGDVTEQHHEDLQSK